MRRTEVKTMEEWTVTQKRFRDKRTGEIVTQFSVLDIANFEEVTE